MAQGKLKVKAKLPQNVKMKKQKGSAVTKRANCPSKSKKKQHEESQKLKQIITKSVNKAMEGEIRSRVSRGQKQLSKVQKAVAEHHSKKVAEVKAT